MKDEEKTFEAYFSGRMSSAKANDFSAALKNNDDLRIEYDQFLALKKSASLIERDKMRKALVGVELSEVKSVEIAERKTTIPILTMSKWVAGIAAILLVAFFAYTSLHPLDPQGLYAQNFETYKVQAARGGSIDFLKTQYREGNYELFIASALKAEESPETNMMLANAYMKTEQFPLAIKTLARISDDTSLRDQKYWYLGLCYLKEDKLESALKNFNQLLSISNYKKVKTEEIIAIINTKMEAI